MIKVTHKMIREYLGHNGHECRVRIKRDGNVYRHGSPTIADRSKDYWSWIGHAEEVKRMIGDELTHRDQGGE